MGYIVCVFNVPAVCYYTPIVDEAVHFLASQLPIFREVQSIAQLRLQGHSRCLVEEYPSSVTNTLSKNI